MSQRPFATFGLFAVVCAAVVLFAFTRDGEGDPATQAVAAQDEAARDLFATNCGTCHTLSAAGTDGVVGPNLDELLVPSAPVDPTTLGDSYDGYYTRVLQAVECGLNGRMPKGILQGEQAQDVSSFVAAYAGQLGDDAAPSVDTSTAPQPPLEGGCPTQNTGPSGG
ncbi:MAG: cytochrome c [Solirubrobacterales bacterium]|nr:cytochrome c [Solirubrobacterales bacterium]